MGEQALLVFALEQQRYALSLKQVQRVIRAVAVTSLPQAPKIVAGIINLAGTAIPVINLRLRFNYPLRPVRLKDHFVIADTGRRTVALQVDEAKTVIKKEVRCSSEVLPNLEHISGVIELEDGIILIQNLDQLLSLEEEALIDKALQEISSEEA